MKRIEVVAAIIKHEGRYLATQRGYGEFKGWWEFPGGKIESEESHHEALVRETREATLAELEHLLHKTYIDNLRPRKAAVYSFDSEPTPMAAEEQVGYDMK